MHIESKKDIGVKPSGIKSGNLTFTVERIRDGKGGSRTAHVWRFESHQNGRYVEVLKESDAIKIFGQDLLKKVISLPEAELVEVEAEAEKETEPKRPGRPPNGKGKN